MTSGPPRVLLVTADYPPMTGGQARYLAEVWSRLPPEAVSVLAPSAAARKEDGPVPVERVWLPSGAGRIAKASKALLLSRAAAAAARRFEPRLVCAGQATAGGVAAWWTRRICGVPYALIIHGGDILGWPGPRGLLRRVLDGASLIIANSGFSLSVARRELGPGFAGRLEVLHPPLSSGWDPAAPGRAPARRALGLGRGDLVLLTVARLVPRKGVASVLDAAASLVRGHPGLRYLVVGDGPERAALEARARALALGPAARFCGFVPDEGLAGYYAAADAFVMPAAADAQDAEGFGMVYLEAQASGLPVVAARVGGAVEAVKEGETAVLVRPGDAGALREALDALLRDPDRRRRLGAAGRAWVRANFDPDRQAGRLWDMLCEAGKAMRSGDECRLCGGLQWEALDGPGGAPARRCRLCGVFERPGHRPSGALASDPRVVEGRRSLHQRLLEELTALSPGGRLLDVGCGSGEFMGLAAERGFKVEGVEPDPGSAAKARRAGLRVAEGLLEETGLDGGYDVVTCWDALDYMKDPLKGLRRMRDLLKPGGWLWVRVRHGPFHMRLWNWGRRLGWKSLASLAVLHRWAFSRESLARALAKAGLTGVRTGPSPLARGSAYTLGAGRATSWAASLFRPVGTLSPSLLAVGRRPQDVPLVLHLITRLDVGGSAEQALLSARVFGGKGSAAVASGPGEEGSRVPGALGVPHLVRAVHPVKDLLAFFEIAALIRRWRPDILHTHSSKAGILGRAAAWALNRTALRRRPVRVVHTPHGHVFYGYFGAIQSSLYLRLERAAARITERLVALSEGERRESLERGVGRPDQWVVIPSGIELDRPTLTARQAKERLVSKGVPTRAVVIGTVARLEPVKGVVHLVEAAGLFLKEVEESRLVIVGEGSERRRIERRAGELGIAEKVLFAGQQRDVLPWIRAMDVYVQPSVNEGMCKTLLYAQALSVPVVASRVCGIPDVVQDGRSGLLVPPGDPDRLAKTVLRLLKDKDLRRRLGEGGPASAGRKDGETGLPYFSSENMFARLRKLYSSMSAP